MATLPLRPAIVGAALLVSAAPFSVVEAQEIGAPPAPLRDLTTDRPDTTESPFTIDAGHLQFETTLFGYARAPRDQLGTAAEDFEFATTNMRIGVTPSVELDIAVRPFGITDPGGSGARTAGVGAVDLRAKINLWGNDGGGSALALLPYVSIPVQRRDVAESLAPDFGLLVPLALDLGGRFGLGLNAGINARVDEPGSGYRLHGIATASLAVSWSDAIGSYFEIAGDAGNGLVSTSLNTGITWQVSDRLQLDTGTQFGVTGDAPRFAPFIGFSLRL